MVHKGGLVTSAMAKEEDRGANGGGPGDRHSGLIPGIILRGPRWEPLLGSRLDADQKNIRRHPGWDALSIVYSALIDLDFSVRMGQIVCIAAAHRCVLQIQCLIIRSLQTSLSRMEELSDV